MIHVRAAVPSDVDDLTRFSIGVGAESEALAPDPARVHEAVSMALADPSRARYFVAEQGGKPVGALFVTYEWSDWNSGWYWWIQGVYVEPDARRQGVYRALYEAVHAAARAAGDVLRIRLYVHDDNKAALQTYRRLGMLEERYRIFDAEV